MNRMTLIKVHILLSTFMLPAALMFLITGGLYTWGYKGSYISEEYAVELAAPLTADTEQLVAVAKAELDARSIAYPTGKAGVKKIGSAYRLEWTGAGLDVLLEPTGSPETATLTIKQTTWYRNLVQLHKAKGGTPFRIYAALLAISLFVILLSGVIMAWQVPKFKKQAIVTLAAGVVAFAAMIILS